MVAGTSEPQVLLLAAGPRLAVEHLALGLVLHPAVALLLAAADGRAPALAVQVRVAALGSEALPLAAVSAVPVFQVELQPAAGAGMAAEGLQRAV